MHLVRFWLPRARPSRWSESMEQTAPRSSTVRLRSVVRLLVRSAAAAPALGVRPGRGHLLNAWPGCAERATALVGRAASRRSGARPAGSGVDLPGTSRRRTWRLRQGVADRVPGPWPSPTVDAEQRRSGRLVSRQLTCADVTAVSTSGPAPVVPRYCGSADPPPVPPRGASPVPPFRSSWRRAGSTDRCLNPVLGIAPSAAGADAQAGRQDRADRVVSVSRLCWRCRGAQTYLNHPS